MCAHTFFQLIGTPTTAPGGPAGPGSPVLPWAPGGPCRVKAKKYTLQNPYSNMTEKSLKILSKFCFYLDTNAWFSLITLKKNPKHF